MRLEFKPDWWKLEGQASKAAWDNIARAIETGDPLCRGVMLLGLEAPEKDLAQAFALAHNCSVVKGLRGRAHDLRRAGGRVVRWPHRRSRGDRAHGRRVCAIGRSLARVRAVNNERSGKARAMMTIRLTAAMLNEVSQKNPHRRWHHGVEQRLNTIILIIIINANSSHQQEERGQPHSAPAQKCQELTGAAGRKAMWYTTLNICCPRNCTLHLHGSSSELC